MTDLAQIAAILCTTEKNARSRVLRLGLGDTCGRCGGSGSYSYNHRDGSTCWGCSGLGQVMPTEAAYPALRLRCEAAAADGRLAAYLDELRAARVVKGAHARIFAAWKPIFDAYPYDWRNSYPRAFDGFVPAEVDRFRAEQNKRIADAFEAFAAVARAYESRRGSARPTATARDMEAAMTTVLQLCEEVRAAVEQHAAGLAPR